MIEKVGNKINYQFIIQDMSLSNDGLIDLLNNYFKVFEPTFMFGENKDFDKQSMGEIKKLDLRFQGLLIEGKDKSQIRFGSISQNRLQPRKFFAGIYLDKLHIPLISEILLSFLNITDFKIGFMVDMKYNFYQSEDNPQLFQLINVGKYDSSEKEIKDFEMPLYFNENIQLYRIDISSNPGRERYLPGMKFIPAYKIWYGKEAQELFGKQKILDYPNAIYVKELDNGVIEMQLMDDINKCDLPYNQEKQRDIVKYFEIEKIEVSKY